MRNTFANNISNWFIVPVAVTWDVKLWKCATKATGYHAKQIIGTCVVEKQERLNIN